MDALKKDLRSVLQSVKEGVPARKIAGDFHGITGAPIPYRALGFRDIQALMNSIPDTVCETWKDGEKYYMAVADESTAHIARMVALQRSKTKKTKGGYGNMRRPTLQIRRGMRPSYNKDRCSTRAGASKSYNSFSLGGDEKFTPISNQVSPTAHRFPSTTKPSIFSPRPSKVAPHQSRAAPWHNTASQKASANHPPSTQSSHQSATISPALQTSKSLRDHKLQVPVDDSTPFLDKRKANPSWQSKSALIMAQQAELRSKWYEMMSENHLVIPWAAGVDYTPPYVLESTELKQQIADIRTDAALKIQLAVSKHQKNISQKFLLTSSKVAGDDTEAFHNYRKVMGRSRRALSKKLSEQHQHQSLHQLTTDDWADVFKVARIHVMKPKRKRYNGIKEVGCTETNMRGVNITAPLTCMTNDLRTSTSSTHRSALKDLNPSHEANPSGTQKKGEKKAKKDKDSGPQKKGKNKATNNKDSGAQKEENKVKNNKDNGTQINGENKAKNNKNSVTQKKGGNKAKNKVSSTQKGETKVKNKKNSGTPKGENKVNNKDSGTQKGGNRPKNKKDSGTQNKLKKKAKKNKNIAGHQSKNNPTQSKGSAKQENLSGERHTFRNAQRSIGIQAKVLQPQKQLLPQRRKQETYNLSAWHC